VFPRSFGLRHSRRMTEGFARYHRRAASSILERSLALPAERLARFQSKTDTPAAYPDCRRRAQDRAARPSARPDLWGFCSRSWLFRFRACLFGGSANVAFSSGSIYRHAETANPSRENLEYFFLAPSQYSQILETVSAPALVLMDELGTGPSRRRFWRWSCDCRALEEQGVLVVVTTHHNV